MTKERIEELRKAQKISLGVDGLKSELRECLDEIERLERHKKIMADVLLDIENASNSEVEWEYRKLAERTLGSLGLI